MNFIKLREKTFKFIYIILGLIIILTALKISGSSIGMWNKYLGDDVMKGGLLIGVPRSIRSDEWLVQTPLGLSQRENDYDKVNKFIAEGEDTAVIYDAPNTHWSTFFKPHNWGFFILPQENAFAFKWWLRGGLLIISTYLLLLVLTRRNYFLSISGSLILFFTPMVQWWYSIQVMEPIAYGFFALYFLIRISRYESIRRLIFYSLALAYSMVAFALAFYPAFQVPVFYVIIFVFVGYLIENWPDIKLNLKTKLSSLFISFAASISMLIAYYVSEKATISAIINTSYPGARFVNGGNYTLMQLLSSPYSFLLELNSTAVPAIFGNQSEASSFITIVLFLLIFPFAIYYIVKKLLARSREAAILTSLSILFLTDIFFIFFGFNNFLAKYSLFYLIPENRLIIGIGLISFLGLILFVNLIVEGKFKVNKNKTIAITTSLFAFIFVALIGRELYKVSPEYIRSKFVIMSISAVFALFIYMLFTKKMKAAIVILVFFSIFSAGFVNPFYYGLKPLKGSEVAEELKEFNKNNNPESKNWIVYDSMFWGNFLIAQGIPTLNGTHLYPQLDVWKKLDPEGKYDYQYNRYSHIIFEESESSETVSFENPVPDTLKIKISPCNGFFKTQNIKFILTEKDLSKYECVNKVKNINNLGIWEYRS